jgi:hypothetical protein
MSETTTKIDPHEWNALQRRLEQMNTRFKMIVGTAIVLAAASVLLWAPFAVSETSSPNEAVSGDRYQPAADSDQQAMDEEPDKQGCYHRFGNRVWTYCNYRDYVAGIDYDNNEDGIGGVYCCPL